MKNLVIVYKLFRESCQASEGIDGPRQFKASIFHSLVEKHGVL